MLIAGSTYLSAQSPAAVSPDPKLAVDTVSRLFAPNPSVIVEAIHKPLPTTGSWGVQGRFPAGPPGACQNPALSCIRVLYRVPEANVVCSWAVGFVPGTANAQGKPTVRPVIVDEDANAALYTLKKDWIEGEARWRITHFVRPVYSLLAASAQATGDVAVRIVVLGDGKVASVNTSSGPKILQGAVSDAVKQWSFAPMRVGSQNSSFQVDWVYHFRGGAPSFSDMGVSGQTFRLPNEHEGPGMVSTSPDGTTWESCPSAAGCAVVAPEVPK